MAMAFLAACSSGSLLKHPGQEGEGRDAVHRVSGGARPGTGAVWNADRDGPEADCVDTGLEGDDDSAETTWSALEDRPECDPDAPPLFRAHEEHADIPYRTRTAFTLRQAPGGARRTVLRQNARYGDWSHRLEFRGDTLARRRIGYARTDPDGTTWSALAGDLTDPALAPWPRGLPRRTLPAGWKPVPHAGRDPGADAGTHPLSAAQPQGVAAGAERDGWSAYALRGWNPVTHGREPPWHAPWILRHVAAGAAVRPGSSWTLAAFASETRVGRDTRDTLSERLASATVETPAGLALTLARAETGHGGHGSRGWMLAADLRRQRRAPGQLFDRARLDVTVRQRDGGFASAWDPAWSAAIADTARERPYGAGEARVAVRIPWLEPRPDRRHAVPRERGFTRVEGWRAWHPATGAERAGERVAAGWRFDPRAEDDAAPLWLEGSLMQRRARAASGRGTWRREAAFEARTEDFPGWRAGAWRAWDGDGPHREGVAFGVRPRFRDVATHAGIRVERRRPDIPETTLETGLRLHALPRRTLALEAGVARTFRPGTDDLRWHVGIVHLDAPGIAWK